MTTGLVRESFRQPPQRDQSADNHDRGFNRYESQWIGVDASGTHEFKHGLGIVPHVVSVLTASDTQGTGQTEATSVTFASTILATTITNGGTARYFRVRAF